MVKKSVLLIFLFPMIALANHSHTREVTVAQAKTLRDDARVMLTGKIISYAGDDDRYWFQDSTGKIRIDVDDDDDDDERRLIGKTVHIIGDVDKDDGRVEIDVDHVVVGN
ncbi:NirD/YgiW/YdeI family stress tolerance protein [Rahnella sp. PD12R]|uniref:NirD/YgiW/YdeI family stress tolerance protein n=1 Tax=Rahnella sp. PD12R TaxID=2855688 RepID=UPI001C492565|nr:NirD/YgiW/YdeI family stress tolerance protein [Rahnella sp. PD12R]MBV6820050.1 NirD/YgiW/YdeI family stress tolerance protein [Rahnella sp. PD12R]